MSNLSAEEHFGNAEEASAVAFDSNVVDGSVLRNECLHVRLVFLAGLRPASDEFCDQASKKGIWWMPWYREAMKDVARCDKPGGDASDR